jgi:hypothetical protein
LPHNTGKDGADSAIASIDLMNREDWLFLHAAVDPDQPVIE